MIAGSGGGGCVRRSGSGGGGGGSSAVEELVRRGLTLALASPHHLAALVAGHEREVVVLAFPADLVDPDVVEIVQTVRVELVVADALDDPPDGVPVDPQHPLDRRLVGPRRQPRDQALEVARELRPRAGRTARPRYAPRAPGTTTAGAGSGPPAARPRDQDAARPTSPAACPCAPPSSTRTPGRPAADGKAPPRRSPGRARTEPSSPTRRADAEAWKMPS